MNFGRGTPRKKGADFVNTPISDHITKNRSLQGEYKIVEEVLEKNNLLINDLSIILPKIVQDSVLGIYLMTEKNEKIPRDQFFQFMMQLDNISIDWMLKKKALYTKLTKQKDFTTHLLFSLLLPFDFELKTKNVFIQ